MNKIKEYVKRLYDIIMTPTMSFLPGNIAFFLVLSIFPILTLIGVIASIFSINVDSLISLINTSLPSEVASVIVSYVDGKGFDSNIFIFMTIGFILASNGAHAIILACNTLYGFPNSNYLKRRIKAFFLIFLMLLLFIFMLGFIAYGNHLLNAILSLISDNNLVYLIKKIFTILRWPFTIFIIYFNVKLIYTIAPDWKILSKHTTRGAIFSTISFILVVIFYSYWVNHFANYDIFYGSVSNIIILMLMTYLISYVLVIGIAINVKTYEYKIED